MSSIARIRTALDLVEEHGEDAAPKRAHEKLTQARSRFAQATDAEKEDAKTALDEAKAEWEALSNWLRYDAAIFDGLLKARDAPRKDWDMARPFLTFLAGMIVTTMVLAGTVLTQIPGIYKPPFEGATMNAALAGFYWELLRRLALTIGAAALMALAINGFRAGYPSRPIRESHRGILALYVFLCSIVTALGLWAVCHIYNFPGI